jgi:serine/threonine protein kinase
MLALTLGDLSDYGMSQILDAFKDRVRYQTEVGPLKWMAPESIRQMLFSPKSDIWAFGVTLMEIWSNGCDPYPEMTPKEVAMTILTEDSFNPAIPEEIPNQLKPLVRRCLSNEPEQRPSAEGIVEFLTRVRNA